MRCFGFAFEGALEEFLRGDEFATIEFDNAAIIKRIRIARQRRFAAQSCFGDGKISARARRYFGDADVFFDKRAEKSSRLCETPARKFFVSTLKST